MTVSVHSNYCPTMRGGSVPLRGGVVRSHPRPQRTTCPGHPSTLEGSRETGGAENTSNPWRTRILASGTRVTSALIRSLFRVGGPTQRPAHHDDSEYSLRNGDFAARDGRRVPLPLDY